MNHLTEDELVLYYYGEVADAEAPRRHLDGCAECRTEYEQLERLLELTADAPVPERGAEYGSLVWACLEPHLAARSRGWWSWLAPPKWALVPVALAAAVILAIRAPTPEAPRSETVVRAAVRDTVLRMEVGDHLERSERFLMEVINDGGGWQRERAEDLLVSNRLLRQCAATATGLRGVDGVLEELEFVLAETANPYAGAVEPEARSGSQEILFKVRTMGDRLRVREIAYATGS